MESVQLSKKLTSKLNKHRTPSQFAAAVTQTTALTGTRAALLVASLAALVTATLAGAPALAAIYKVVDENGNVVFTDVPPNAGEGQPVQ